MKLRKGDTVKVLSGNDKGKTGEILSVDVKNNKVIVIGFLVNLLIQANLEELEKKAESLHQNIQ